MTPQTQKPKGFNPSDSYSLFRRLLSIRAAHKKIDINGLVGSEPVFLKFTSAPFSLFLDNISEHDIRFSTLDTMNICTGLARETKLYLKESSDVPKFCNMELFARGGSFR